MSKFVLIVDLEIKPEGVETYLTAVKEQAENTVRLEPGCYRFDVVRSLDGESKFTHYEIFENAEAFETHAKMPHTLAFRDHIQKLVLKTEIRRGTLAAAG